MKRESSIAPLHVSDDACLDLVHGLLDAAERDATLDHLRECAVCETRFRDTAASHARALSAATTLGAQRVREPGPVLPAALGGRIGAVRWLLVASVVAVVGTGWIASRSRPDTSLLSGAAVRLPSTHMRSAIRGFGATPIDSAVAAGLDAYERGDRVEARRLLEGGRATDRLEDVRRIYLGCALLELGEPDAARTALDGVRMELVPEPWRGEARWAQAVASARSGDAATAVAMLREFVREGGPLAERARAHLGEAR